MEQSSWSHPEHLEEVEGEIIFERLSSCVKFYCFFHFTVNNFAFIIIFYIFLQVLLKSLAEAELDDAKDLVEEDTPALTPVVRERGSVQLSTIPEPVTVQGWPMGLALASAPSMTVSLTATGFQKMMSVIASLNLPSRRGEYQVKTNQYTEELASIRAQPKVRTQTPSRNVFILFI